jgi:hypothetical protein
MQSPGSSTREVDLRVPHTLDNAQDMYPDDTQLRNFDEEAMGCQWAHFRRERQFWEHLILDISLITPIGISYVIMFDCDVSAGVRPRFSCSMCFKSLISLWR